MPVFRSNRHPTAPDQQASTTERRSSNGLSPPGEAVLHPERRLLPDGRPWLHVVEG